MAVESSKSKRQKSSRDENLDNFEKMITNCGNESGAHLLYNGPCDVIGECVKVKTNISVTLLGKSQRLVSGRKQSKVYFNILF